MSAAAKGTGGGKEPVPGDEQALAQEIGQTREELGETVAALAAKADVKARAAQKVHELTGRLTSKVSDIGERASGRAGQARGTLTGQAERGRTLLAAAPSAGQQVREQSASGVGPARQAGQRVASTVRRYPLPTALFAAALLLAIVAAAGGRRS